jgi:hypothetical protein
LPHFFKRGLISNPQVLFTSHGKALFIDTLTEKGSKQAELQTPQMVSPQVLVEMPVMKCGL